MKKQQQSLANSPLWARAAPRHGGSMLVMMQVRAGIVALFLVSLATAAQPEVIRCLPPEVPVTDLPEAVLAEYRAEIGAEFEAYFSAITTHIACLDDERTRALAEVRDAADVYATFLNVPPAQKDLP